MSSKKTGISLELGVFQYLHSLKFTQAVGEMCFALRIERRKKEQRKKGAEEKVEWLQLAQMLVIHHT